VRVEGEVAAPGVYQAIAGETLPQLLKRMGGLTPQSYVFGTEFNRESVKTRQQENLDKLIRRLEAQSQSQQGVMVANKASTGSAEQTAAIMQQQQAQLKGQIERLKSLKSNGRMALELDPTTNSLAALPDLPLEDGDRILVPNVPGFVSAFGSVNNENVFIYKPGKTVGDVIKSAGLTEDAEPSQAFVLRADGSIVARNDRSGWFGGGFESLAMMPGDALVVPAQMDRESRYNAFIRGFKDWTQILSNLGLGVAAFRSMGY
jgi:protein involved in polysaccharide export with SLBB domain